MYSVYAEQWRGNGGGARVQDRSRGRGTRTWRPKLAAGAAALAANGADSGAPGAAPSASLGPPSPVAQWLCPGGEAQQALARDGVAVLRGALPAADRMWLLGQIEAGVARLADWKLYRARAGPGEEMRPRTVDMGRLGFGRGLYTYLKEPLPEPLQALRSALYAALAPLANGDLARHAREVAPKPFAVDAYPSELEVFHELCRVAKPPQVSPTCLALQYRAGGHNLPHRDIYGCISFPYQALCLLTVPGRDFAGGDFYTQPSKGANDKRRHIRLGAGDLLVFRSSMWHGSEPVARGRRVAVGLQFHLAQA